MTMRKTLQAALAAALFIFSMQASAAKPDNVLSGDDVKKLVSGKTVKGTKNKGKSIDRTFSADGSVSFNGKSGKWNIDEKGRLCQEFGAKKDCMRIEKEKDGYTSHASHQLRWTFKVN
jgi:hypothetical protein